MPCGHKSLWRNVIASKTAFIQPVSFLIGGSIMQVRAKWLLLSLTLLAVTSQGVPFAQQDTPGQAPAGRGGGGGRGGGAARSQAEKDYVAPPRSPINKATNTVRPVTDAMLRNPDPGDW